MTVRRAALGGAASLSILLALYAALPWLVAHALPPLLARWGVESSRFDIGHPRWHGVRIERFEFSTASATVSGNGVDVTYSPLELVRGELDTIAIEDVSVRVAPAATRTPGGSLELPAFWSLIPARRVEIRRLALASDDPAVSAVGDVAFDRDILRAAMRIDSAVLADPLDLHASIDPDGRVAASVAESGTTEPIATLVGTIDRSRAGVEFDVRATLRDRPLALAAAYANVEAATGSADATCHGRAPWPLPAADTWRSLEGRCRFTLDVSATSAQVAIESARMNAELTLANGAALAHVEPSSAVTLRIAREAVRPIVAHVEIAANERIDVAYEAGRLRVADGAVVTADVGGKPVRVRVRGALGADRDAELVVTAVDGAPVLLARSTPGEAGTMDVKARLALGGRLLQAAASAFDVEATGGRATLDFVGRVRWPIDPRAGLQNVSGKGRAQLASTARIAGRLVDASIDAGFAIDDAVRATVDPGAQVVVADTGIDVSTASAAAIDVNVDPLRVAVGAFDCKVALPPVAVGERTIAIRDGWASIERATFTADAIEASATLRTHAGRGAWPLEISLKHDPARRRGTFTGVGDWTARPGALKSELPGFAAPYDIDGGRIAVRLTGQWDAANAPPAYSIDGRVTIDAGQAHYADYALAGVRAELPVSLRPEGFAIADTTIAIETIDVGFPIREVSLGVALRDGVARVNDFGGALLGGRFTADAFDFDVAASAADVELSLNGISLAEVLALEGTDVQGTGTLDGRLPISLRGDSVTIANGRIMARAPGGTLKYAGAPVPSIADKAGLAFAFKALEDFRYDALDAKVALGADGVLALGVRLQGANPAVEQGRPIQFNLNLTESLPALFESLRAAERITRRVEKQFVR